ncbi:hypothetical protein GSI_04776 [Ganoderma sinense ZZ0214-1]|uniref:Uncharacterized protein n=1 Tax=Ganoderma sinense ZZ0214-1 TaxID=1077348 RepID=A0A2G8SHS3_9APHY|nr:hypothetical protein GSI_04776 [Ganoderma sinense ZZ0214-1]
MLDEHPARRFPLSRILANEAQANFISIASRGPRRVSLKPCSRQGSRQVSLLDPDASPTAAHRNTTDSGVHKHRRVCACALEPRSAWLAAR